MLSQVWLTDENPNSRHEDSPVWPLRPYKVKYMAMKKIIIILANRSTKLHWVTWNAHTKPKNIWRFPDLYSGVVYLVQNWTVLRPVLIKLSQHNSLSKIFVKEPSRRLQCHRVKRNSHRKRARLASKEHSGNLRSLLSSWIKYMRSGLFCQNSSQASQMFLCLMSGKKYTSVKEVFCWTCV